MVYGAALEKRSPVIPERGFESHPLRQPAPRLRLVNQTMLRLRLVNQSEQARLGKPDKLCGTHIF